MNQPIVRMNNISKSFPGVKALDQVSVAFNPGEVHILIGENGAGKSTLIKILSGVYSLDEGSVEYKGETVSFQNAKQAIDYGISIIHQELSVVNDLTVAENIFLGRECKKNLCFINKKKMKEDAKKILQTLDMDIDPGMMVRYLSTAEQQMVEIAKALSQNASVVIMDEPTSSISEQEVKSLFNVINKLKKNGVAIIYISHRLKEIYEIGDRITVLRDGKLIETLPIETTNENLLISKMVGREIKQLFSHKEHIIGDTVLEVKGLTRKKYYSDVSFNLKKGEVLGIAGLIGAGRTEVLRGVFGADKYDSGQVLYNGKAVNFSRPEKAIKQGIGLVPEDRRNQGVLLENDVARNISLPSVRYNKKKGFVDKRWEKEKAKEYVEKLNIKTPSISTLTKTLSGGNQQKVAIAKWMVAQSDVLLLDEPTRGIDVNAKSEIYKLIDEFSLSGGSVLMVSSELPELLGCCDRILVMRNGCISGELGKEEASEEKIMKLASLS